MSLDDQQITRLEALIEPLAIEAGLELVDIETTGTGRGTLLSVLIDKKGGVNVDDCADLSRQISYLLDVEDPIGHEYRLEVSSPGLFRKLKKDKDLVRHQGDRVKIKLTEPIEGEFTWVGQLASFDNQNLVLQEEGQSRDLVIERRLIKKINLEPKLF
ncbi:MAG: hypothetical protein A2527_08075 [Candidatus Lambdaproteobacteria bacterium RIFOXYD2_FULL_50_16]|uniref:Ribosome maturation factor RimP n=1 Tax=Candidatus Lambdaproteobacteria bacterium RIFOXYD2_FULL_50_16 TaxID=1817772 RepID=A0A1F6GAL9_9PROT|nr:MAG: hypothetical protein A2527_08075 [Candidatus Lambdaproteobacteria bacterium RIFOXYD2_FULL_50_16]